MGSSAIAGRWTMRRLSAVGLAALLVAGTLAVAMVVTVASGETAGVAYYTITPPSQVVQSDATEVAVDININDVNDLGAFEFRLVYAPTVLKFKEVRRGPFIGSSGRTVTCLTGQRTTSTVQWGCTSTGQVGTGVSGSGLAATVVFAPVGVGTSPLVFNKVEFADTLSDAAMPSSIPHEGAVQVVGPDDPTNEPPPPTPTHDATLLTPTPVADAPTPDNTYRLSDPQRDDVEPGGTPPAGMVSADDTPGTVAGSGALAETPGSDPAASGTEDAASGGSARPSSSGRSSGVLGTRGSGFPVAGYGATAATVELAARIPFAGRVLLCAGAALLAAGIVLSRRRQARQH